MQLFFLTTSRRTCTIDIYGFVIFNNSQEKKRINTILLANQLANIKNGGVDQGFLSPGPVGSEVLAQFERIEGTDVNELPIASMELL